MEPRPDFEALKHEIEGESPRRTKRDVLQALWQGAQRAFVGLVPPPLPRRQQLSRERYGQILHEFDELDRQAASTADQPDPEKLAEVARRFGEAAYRIDDASQTVIERQQKEE